MSVLSRLAASGWRLPPATHRRVGVIRGLRMPMPDGVELVADRYHPPGTGPSPVVLIRTPYGRRPLGGGLMARLLAERGLQVVLQSTRGTFDSGGAFEPFQRERADGAATVAWLREQPWCDGRVAMWGASYEGYTQWAAMAEPSTALTAVAVQLGGSDMRESFVHPSGIPAIGDVLAWARIVLNQGSFVRVVITGIGAIRRLPRAYATRPIEEADRVAVGRPVPFVREWLAHPDPDDWWARLAHRDASARHPVPAHLIAGWHDIYLATTIADFAAVRAAGCPARLVLGPWRHMDTAWHGTAFTEGLRWLSARLAGEGEVQAGQPVRAYLMGWRPAWLELPDWPPPGGRTTLRYAGPDGTLAEVPGRPIAVRFRYDPVDPTPSAGGLIAFERTAGPVDNRRLEARPDVRCWTGPVLDEPFTVAGSPVAEVALTVSARPADVFVRLCDVAPDGVSRNVTDGITRLPAGEPGPTSATVTMAPTAYRFGPGHRLRVQISGGAHPRWARNDAGPVEYEIGGPAGPPLILRLPELPPRSLGEAAGSCAERGASR
jgi:putative CocE/NonD family hydrolase